MPTLLPRKPLSPIFKLLIGVKVLRWRLKVARYQRVVRTGVARVFMYLTKWHAIAACRSLNIALKIAPWLQGSGSTRPR
jgi:hypothetical protein